MTKVWQRHIEEIPTQKTAFRGKDMWQDFWRRPLAATPEQLDDSPVHGRDIFGNKTQGEPFHLAVLAVAMVIETRLPRQAFVFGDFDRQQCERRNSSLRYTLGYDHAHRRPGSVTPTLGNGHSSDPY